MRRTITLPALAAAVLLAASCEKSATSPDDASLSAADAALLAEEFDALSSTVLTGELVFFGSFSAAPGNAAPLPIGRTFTVTRQCPAGGSVTVSGSTTGEADRATRSLTLETSATKTQNACVYPARNGTKLTVSGSPNVVIRGSQKVVNGQPSGPQTLTHKGGFTWTSSDGRSGSCQVDIAATLDPAARTRTVKGTLCGRTVDVTRQLGRG